MTEQVIKQGKYVTLSYTIMNDEGQVLEQHDVPIGFVYGSDTALIGGMDRAVFGRKAGDEVELKVPPEQGFGAHDPALTFTDDIANVPPEFRRIGAEVRMQNESGEVKTFYVTNIENGRLTVDGNHPMAGKTLTVKVKIHDVRDAQPGEDKMSGIHASQNGAGGNTLN